MRVWQLLDKADRSAEEDELMIHAAHASHYHWLQVGTRLNRQRGESLLARVYSVLGVPAASLLHAGRCLELTGANGDAMADFDRAYAFEGLARANALAGNRDEALELLKRAEEAGEKIEGEKDRDILVNDLNGGDWHGVR